MNLVLGEVTSGADIDTSVAGVGVGEINEAGAVGAVETKNGEQDQDHPAQDRQRVVENFFQESGVPAGKAAESKHIAVFQCL